MIKKITPYKQSLRGNDHMIIVDVNDYDSKSQRLLVSLNNKVVEARYNPKSKRATAKLDLVTTNQNNPMAALLPQNPDIRIKVFVYDFLKDQIINAKLQEFEYFPQLLDYKPSDELLTTSPVIISAFDLKGLREKAMKEEKLNYKPRQIVKIEVSQGKTIDNLTTEFKVDVFLNDFVLDISYNPFQIIEVEISGQKTTATYYENDQTKKNQLFAKVKTLLPKIPQVNETYDLTVNVLEKQYAWEEYHITNLKVIKILVNNDGSVRELKNESAVCLAEAKVRAFMRMLRIGEGTPGEKGYSVAFGGNVIKDLSTHPQKNYGGSTAAGAYQIMRYTYWWLNGQELNGKNEKTGVYNESHDYIKKYSIPDYEPESQDKLCIIIFKYKRAGLVELIVGDEIEKAIREKASLEWASLPNVGDNSHYIFKGKPQAAKPMKICLEKFEEFLKDEIEGKTDLHLKNGFLKEFGFNYCTT